VAYCNVFFLNVSDGTEENHSLRPDLKAKVRIRDLPDIMNSMFIIIIILLFPVASTFWSIGHP
jgi:hypothetical protein